MNIVFSLYYHNLRNTKNVTIDFIKFMSFEKLENVIYYFHERCQQVIRIIIVMHIGNQQKCPTNMRYFKEKHHSMMPL